MFELITPVHEKEIFSLINKIGTLSTTEIVEQLAEIINHIHADIPEKKKISYGRYSIVKKVGLFIYPLLEQKKVDVNEFAWEIYRNQKYDTFVRSLAVQLFSIYGFHTGELTPVLSLFEKAAMDEQWEMRECSAGFIRKLVKKYPETMQPWYVKMATSANAMQRRFAIESIRPVADNKWFRKNSDFAFSILELLYKEPEAYPRTSVGNSLSDWMRIDEKKTFEVIKKLASNGDANSYWIAYRACRNFVKKEPLLVMDTLKKDCYKYKDRLYYRNQCT